MGAAIVGVICHSCARDGCVLAEVGYVLGTEVERAGAPVLGDLGEQLRVPAVVGVAVARHVLAAAVGYDKAVGHSSVAVELCGEVELPGVERRLVGSGDDTLELVLQRLVAEDIGVVGGGECGLPHIGVAECRRHGPAAEDFHIGFYLPVVRERLRSRYIADIEQIYMVHIIVHIGDDAVEEARVVVLARQLQLTFADGDIEGCGGSCVHGLFLRKVFVAHTIHAVARQVGGVVGNGIG